MSDITFNKSLEFIKKIGATSPLFMHIFGEPIMDSKFDKRALALSKIVSSLSFSTNGVLLTEKWADKLAKIKWEYITISPWNLEAQEKATKLLTKRGINVTHAPGATHDWAGQASNGGHENHNYQCPFIGNGWCVIRWDGTVSNCCITDREQDVLGHVSQEPWEIKQKTISLCESCHHTV